MAGSICRSTSRCSTLLSSAGDFDFQRAAAAGAPGQLGAHHSPRTSGEFADATAGEAVISWPCSAASRRKRASIARSGSPFDAAFRSRSRQRSIAPTRNITTRCIRPLIKANPLVEYIGEIADHEKPDFLSGAIGLLVPIDWPEPFGLVMIEAMACGTPVIAYNRGSVPEIIDDGVTGFIVEDEISAVAAVDRLSTLDRAAIRKQFEARFTARRMALDYLAAYRSLMEAAAPRMRLVSSAE